MEFEIGMKVVYVGKGDEELVRDKIYTISNIGHCCEMNLDVGFTYDPSQFRHCGCDKCKAVLSTSGVTCCRASVFVPLQEYTRQEEQIKELIEPLKVKVDFINDAIPYLKGRK